MSLAQKPWDRNLQLMLAMTVAFNVMPQLHSMPLWVTAVAFGSVIWKVFYLTKGLQLPRKWFLGLGTIGGAVGVFVSYSTIIGQDAAGALLVVMASLKLLETNRYRDAMFVMFTSYFLLMGSLLESQSLAMTVYMVIDVFLITALMYQVHRRDHSGSSSRRLLAGWPWRLLALTIPLWIFLFFLFPRFSASLWNLRAPEAGSGFSDDINPGAIDHLVESDEPAFRIQFQGTPGLPPESFYWRGGILSNGNGLKWTKSNLREEADGVLPNQAKPQWQRDYEVYLEPGYSTWLFGLDTPTAITTTDRILQRLIRPHAGSYFETAKPLVGRVAYDVHSIVPAPLQTLSAESTCAIFTFTFTPRSPCDGTRAEYQEAVFELPAFARFPEATRLGHGMIKWFGDQGFKYTKSPGQMRSLDGADQLTEFLFETKVGFCEHYSTSFASMLRAMGIPARVVVGFQGASYNEYGEYWLVRKLDAHAWAEIWQSVPGDETTGRWVRFDPTESVAPLRLQLGGDYNRLDPASIAVGATSEELNRQLNGGLTRILRKAQAAWDLVQMQWNAFLLYYDAAYQSELLARLGIHQGAVYVLFGIIVIGLISFAGLMIWRLRTAANRHDPLLTQWQKFCASFEASGVQRASNEGPLHFASRAIAARPAVASQTDQIAQQFMAARYGPALSRGEEKALAAGLARAIRDLRRALRES